jgi:hypothetical protein
MPAVHSSAIRGIDYDEPSRTLLVIFIDGDGYGYADVPPELYAEFLHAESKGRFFAERVRGRFDYQEVT